MFPYALNNTWQLFNRTNQENKCTQSASLGFWDKGLLTMTQKQHWEDHLFSPKDCLVLQTGMVISDSTLRTQDHKWEGRKLESVAAHGGTHALPSCATETTFHNALPSGTLCIHTRAHKHGNTGTIPIVKLSEYSRPGPQTTWAPVTKHHSLGYSSKAVPQESGSLRPVSSVLTGKEQGNVLPCPTSQRSPTV